MVTMVGIFKAVYNNPGTISLIGKRQQCKISLSFGYMFKYVNNDLMRKTFENFAHTMIDSRIVEVVHTVLRASTESIFFPNCEIAKSQLTTQKFDQSNNCL